MENFHTILTSENTPISYPLFQITLSLKSLLKTSLKPL